MDINYELYKVFYHVATTLSFSEASKHLYISQSAVSQSIKTLEKKLDRVLFTRSTKKVQLTPAGEILLKHVEPAMNLLMRGEDELLDASNLGQLRIAASDTICRYFLVPYFKKFHQLFPNVPIKVTNATSLDCVTLLEHGKVDFIICNAPNVRLAPEYMYKTVQEFSDVFIANPVFFPLKEKTVTFQDLTAYPILMLEKNSTTSEFLHTLFLKHQLELIPEIELNSNDLLIDLARIGLGIAVVPDYCLRQNAKDLYIVETKEAIPPRKMIAAVNPSLSLSASSTEFLKLLPTV